MKFSVDVRLIEAAFDLIAGIESNRAFGFHILCLVLEPESCYLSMN